jgi:hypothetical protein
VKEEDLFNYLLENVYPDLVKSRSQFSKWDCYSPIYYHRIELKCRTVHYDTLIIEKPKYEALMVKSIENLDVPIYINSTPKGVYRFNLFKVDPVWEVKYLKKTTTFSNNKKVPKEIAYLPVIDAEIL